MTFESCLQLPCCGTRGRPPLFVHHAEDAPEGEEEGDESDVSEDEAEDAATDIEPAMKKRRIRTKTAAVPGEDNGGKQLPTDDTSNYTAQQYHVFNKLLKDLSPEARIKIMDKMSTKSGKKQLVNSLIAKDASYGDQVAAKDIESTGWFCRTTKVIVENRDKHEQVGFTLTEAEVKCGGQEGLQRGLSRGDVQARDGFYYFKRHTISNLKIHSDTKKVDTNLALQLEDAELAQDALCEDAKALTPSWGTGVSSGSSKGMDVGLKIIGATPRAMAALQEGYDNMVKACRLGREQCKSLADTIDEAPSIDTAGTCQNIIAKTLGKVRQVRFVTDPHHELHHVNKLRITQV